MTTATDLNNGSRTISVEQDGEKVQIVDVDEVFLSYMPGRAAQVRVRAVSDLAEDGAAASATRETAHAH